jgi:hypothetical protein
VKPNVSGSVWEVETGSGPEWKSRVPGAGRRISCGIWARVAGETIGREIDALIMSGDFSDMSSGLKWDSVLLVVGDVLEVLDPLPELPLRKNPNKLLLL